VLRNDLLTYFEDKRMLTSVIEIESPEYVRLEITVEIGLFPYFIKERVQAAAEAAVADLFDFEKADFKQTLYLSKVYEALEGLEGVDFVVVHRFRRADSAQDIPPEGKIVMDTNEIAVLQPEDLAIESKGGI
jgi:hypothetical protein